MVQFVTFFVVLSFSILSSASNAATASLLKPYPETVLRYEVVMFHPASNHHFSLEAPQNCGTGTVVDRGAREISCQFQKAGDAKIALNVCDDKKTYCKPMEFSLKVKTQVADQKVLEPKNPQAVAEIRKTLVPGFTEGTPGEIKKLAHDKKLPVFMMISTEWCPPCNETKEFLFPSAAFQKASANWFKVYVDGDAMLAGEWEKVVPYEYFPSMVMLNSELQEVGRFTKEVRQSEFTAWAAEQEKNLAMPIPKLRAKVLAHKSNADEDMRLLAWALDANDKKLIASVRKKAGTKVTEDLQIRLTAYDVNNLDKQISAVEKGSDKEKTLLAEKEKMLTDLVTWTAAKDDFEDYLGMLCEANIEKCKTFAPQMDKRFEIIKAWKGLTPAELASALAEEGLMQHENFEAMGNAKKAKDSAVICADQYEALMKASSLKMARSGGQGRVHCLEMSGRDSEAEALVEKLMKAYPDEPTFLVRMAKLKKKQKKLDEAYAWIQKAEKLAYGYNWYSAILFKASLELEMKNRDAALGTLSGALAQVNLPEEKDRRNHQLVERIRSLQENIKSSN
jgi:hypothetical protein